MVSARVMISGGVKIGKKCWLGSGSSIIDRISIADNTFLGTGTNVIKSILEPNQTWVGNPARRIK
jgi:UDP-3-O-[3-hydroxymyristoyl] glucosamine N-acyltransferase